MRVTIYEFSMFLYKHTKTFAEIITVIDCSLENISYIHCVLYILPTERNVKNFK